MYGFGDGFMVVVDVYCLDVVGYGIQLFFVVLILYVYVFFFDNNVWIVFFEYFVLEQVVLDVGFICCDDLGQVVVEVIVIYCRFFLLFLKCFYEILSENRFVLFWCIFVLILGI